MFLAKMIKYKIKQNKIQSTIAKASFIINKMYAIRKYITHFIHKGEAHNFTSKFIKFSCNL